MPAQSAALRAFRCKAALCICSSVYSAQQGLVAVRQAELATSDPLQGPRRRLAPGHGFGWIGSRLLQRIGHAAIP